MKISWERIEAKAAEPFRISRSVQTAVTLIWVRVEADGIEPEPKSGRQERLENIVNRFV